ncbi:subtilisin-like protein [Apiospora arundinis]
MSALKLAVQAIDNLRPIVDDLCSLPQCVQFCATLKAILIDLSKLFRGLSENGQSEKEAIALLEQLENLCKLKETPNEPVPPSAGIYERRFSAVASLGTNPDSVIPVILDLASNREAQRQRRTILASLECFFPQILDEQDIDISPTNADLRFISKEPPECGREIQSLHTALLTHCLCTDITDEMVARIRLRGTLEENSTGVTFGMLFMSHPHRTNPGLQSHPWWQDTQISIHRTINFETSLDELDYDEIRSDSETPFCSYISAQDEIGLMVLKFIVKGSKMYFDASLDPSIHWGFDRPSISLGQLLGDLRQSPSDLTEKLKEVLSWLLAKSAWQYYSSPWMRQPWNKESVHFLLERRCNEEGREVTGIFVNEPLLSVSIPRDTQVAEENTEKASAYPGTANKIGTAQRRLPSFGRPLHPIPKMLALGVMLVEIQLGQPIESLYIQDEWAKYCPQGKKNQNTDYKICRDIIAKKHFFEDISDPLEVLIKNCIQPSNPLKPPQVRDEDGIRCALYHLVNRLEVYLSKRKPHSVKPLHLLDKSPSSPIPSSMATSSPSLPKPKATRPGRTMENITNSTSTRDWFKRMASLNYILKAKDGDVYSKVKIAVLDTGVDPRDAASVYIDGYRDFVSGDDSVKCDTTGHGTTSVNLIFDMFESASVHVVRIFETNVANDNTHDLAIQALDWCIEEQMDVVCLACGFADSSQPLFDKVHEASGKMLILSAPTNERNAGEIAYPARYDDVLCIFSTDGGVTKSQKLNPSKGMGIYNFAILGECIKTMSGEERSGTSLSTAIAAGLVGRFLEFSRHSDCSPHLKKRSSMLKVKYGMTKALMAMTVEDSGFHCLKPWKLLPEDLKHQIPFEDYGYPHLGEREMARDYMCNLITMSLADAWK